MTKTLSTNFYTRLRFACGCLNERTNGTIHFGLANEIKQQACGYEPRQVVGCRHSSKPLLNKKLAEYIDKCFVGESRSNVHKYIRPPLLTPVKREEFKQLFVDKNNKYILLKISFGQIVKKYLTNLSVT